MRFPFLLLLPVLIFFGCATTRQVLYTKTESDLIPEGIAVDEKTGIIYVGSIDKRKIILIDQNSVTRDFVPVGRDGLKEVLGLKVDNKRNWLWALSNLQRGNNVSMSIHAFDLSSGKTMQQHTVDTTGVHLFNDLVVANNGNLFLTDTEGSALYEFFPGAGALKLIARDGLLKYPNGLAFGDRYLYVATYTSGILKVDTATKQISRLTGESDTLISHGIDGLVHYQNSLIGVYNIGDSATNCIIRYHLSPDGSRIEREEIIDRGNSLFADPTTAAIVNDRLYVLANSYLDLYNRNKMSTKGIEQKLAPVRVLTYKLR